MKKHLKALLISALFAASLSQEILAGQGKVPTSQLKVGETYKYGYIYLGTFNRHGKKHHRFYKLEKPCTSGICSVSYKIERGKTTSFGGMWRVDCRRKLIANGNSGDFYEFYNFGHKYDVYNRVCK